MVIDHVLSMVEVIATPQREPIGGHLGCPPLTLNTGLYDPTPFKISGEEANRYLGYGGNLGLYANVGQYRVCDGRLMDIEAPVLYVDLGKEGGEWDNGSTQWCGADSNTIASLEALLCQSDLGCDHRCRGGELMRDATERVSG